MHSTPIPRGRLGAEIAVVLALKVIALSLIWHAFFSQPLDEHLSNEKVGHRLFDSVPHHELRNRP